MRPANRRQSLQPRRKNRPTATKTASGIPYWPSRDPIGEEGGVNLYGFLRNDDLDNYDYLGLWTDVFRNHETWASTCAESADTWLALANKLHLEANDVDKWVANFRALDFLGPSPGRIYLVPNTVVVFGTSAVNEGGYIFYHMKTALNNAEQVDTLEGFKVIKRMPNDDAALFKNLWRSSGLYRLYFGGHGARASNDGGWTWNPFTWQFQGVDIAGDAVNPESVSPLYRLARLEMIACGSFRNRSFAYVPGTSRTWTWQEHVSKNGGIFVGCDGYTTGMNMGDIKTQLFKPKKDDVP